MFKKQMSARDLVYLFKGIELHPWGFLLFTCTRPIVITFLVVVASWCR